MHGRNEIEKKNHETTSRCRNLKNMMMTAVILTDLTKMMMMMTPAVILTDLTEMVMAMNILKADKAAAADARGYSSKINKADDDNNCQLLIS